VKLKTYILAAGLLIAGILAVATTISVVFPSEPSLNATATSSLSRQPEFITTITSVGGAAITEILVNTAVQFPLADRPLLPSSLINSIQLSAFIIFLVLMITMVGLVLTRKT
jgi:hypothetical protein